MEKYNEKIDRHTDWGGDASTGGLKVSGRRVQEFIKEELNSKVGAIYKGEGSSVVYCFANDEDKEKFLLSGDTSVILTSFETFSKYKVIINQETLQRSHSVIYGTQGNVVEFQFKIVDESEMITDSKASIEYSFLANGNVTGYTVETQMNADGWTTVTSEVIDRFLKKGENTITIAITGLSTRAQSQFIITYNLFDLNFETTFDYKTVQTTNVISIPYTIECSDTKYLEFYLDGVPVYSSESMVITDVRKQSTARVSIASLEPGTHTLQCGAYVRANDGTEFHAPYHYYTFAKIGSNIPSFLMSLVLNKKQALALDGEGLVLNLDQFEQLSFKWSIYDALTRRLNVIAEYDGEVVARALFDSNGTENTLTFRPMNHGNGKLLKIYALDEDGVTKIFEHTISLNVKELSSGIKETTDGLLLKLEANGRRNSDEGRNIWKCVGSDGVEYSATFNNFEWNSQQGWNAEDEALVISKGATVEFNIRPMAKAWSTYGGTFEIDLETFDIDDDNAVICECKDNIEGVDSSYFRITATNAEFSTSSGVKINTRYKDNERLKIAFIGNKISNQEDGNLIYIVVNGVLERAALYEDFDTLVSNAILKIGNPEGKCKVKLRSIRIYDRGISVDEEFNNFVVDSNNVQELYEKNNILKEGTTEVGFDEIANKLPVMIFTGDMDDINKNGQDKKWRYFDVEFINRQHPEFNFVSFNCQMKLQGTSSLGYPRKNFKLKTKDKDFNAERYAELNYEIDENSTVGNKMLRNKTTGELVDFGEVREICITLGVDSADTTTYVPLKKGKYRFKKGCHKADKWTLKADFMESSCSHNVGAGRSWNDIFENTKFELTIDSPYTNNTYSDDALVIGTDYNNYIRNDGVSFRVNNNGEGIRRQKDYVCRTDAQKICKAENADDIRTAVDGFPMVCFYRTSHQSNNLIFMGQYNFINDKSSYEVFGFEDIDDPTDPTEKRKIYDASKVECWEGLKNANPISLFQTISGWSDSSIGWASTYESRFPDPDDYGVAGKRWYDASEGTQESEGSPLYELSKWLVSTRHSGDTIYDLNGNVKTTSDTLTIDSWFARRINGYQYGYTEDTKDSYQYADGEMPDTAENRQKKFETEKWEHFDVWKLAGYYIYLMRYGAVDQFVKNTMLFTDGNGRYDPRTDKKFRKWFFINYDNDCLFGLRNNGELAFHWKLDRQTLDGAAEIIHDENDEYTEQDVNTYAMMGHDSTLWNNLEADDEFMRMVRDLDNAMSSYGLNYNNMVTEFDTNQTEQWCERVYNANERYKYIQAAKGIGDMSGNPVNNLWMLQGTRRSHRHWWIANHFNLLNAKWLSGDYKSTYVEIKTDAPAGKTIRAVAGVDYYFAWGQQKKIYESNMERREGDNIDFTFTTDQVQGDPVYIYAINKLSEMDFSDIAYKITTGSFEFHMPDTNVSNLLKKLVIGNKSVTNTATGITTSSWECLKNLEYLDITNFEGIKIIPLSSFSNLHVLKATGSGISSFVPAEGSYYTLVELPKNISSLTLRDIKFDNLREHLVYTPNVNLQSLILSNNNGIGIAYFEKLVKPWLQLINNSSQYAEIYDRAVLDVSNIKWEFSSLEDVWLFKKIAKNAQSGNFSLKGVINLVGCGSLSQAAVEEIKDIFGENCFNETMSSLYIKTPDSIFIIAPTEEHYTVAGQDYTFDKEIYPDERAVMADLQDIKYGIVRELAQDESREGALYDPTTGKYYREYTDLDEVRQGLQMVNNANYTGTLKSVERALGYDTNMIVVVKMKTMSNPTEKISCMDFTVKDPTYARRGIFVGEKNIYKGNEFTYSIEGRTGSGEKPLGTHTVTWTLTGEGLNFIAYSGTVGNDLVIRAKDDIEPERYSAITAKAHYVNNDATHSDFEITQTLLVLNSNVVITNATNPIVMNICYNKGWAASNQVMLKSEAEAVINIGTSFCDIGTEFSFQEFSYFTSVTGLTEGAFANSSLTNICLPSSIRSLGKSCFKNCSHLEYVCIKSGDSLLYTLPDSITTIPESCFEGCTSFNKLKLPDNVTSIEDFSFGGTNIKHILLHTEELVDNSLILPDTGQFNSDFAIGGLSFELNNDVWGNANTINNSVNKLETISIPEKIRFTSNHIFWSKKLANIIVHPDCEKMISEDNVLYTYDKSTLLRYAPMKPYSISFTVPNDTVLIAERAFYGVQTLDELSLGLGIGVAGLSRAAFENSKMKSIDMSKAVQLKRINDYTFDGCTELTELLFPEYLQFIDSYAFKECTSMADFNLPDSVTEINNNAFYRCNSIVHLHLPKYCIMNDDHDCLASECQNLSAVTLPIFSHERGGSYEVYDSENELVGTYETKYEANKNKPDGGSVVMITEGESVVVNQYFMPLIVHASTNLHVYFLNEEDDGKLYQAINGVLYSLNKTFLVKIPFRAESYVMPDSVTNIDANAFNNCSLTALTLSKNITKLENMANIYIYTLRVPKKVSRVEASALQNCHYLKDIVFEGHLTYFAQNGLSGCENLEEVYFNGGVDVIDMFAFTGCSILSKIVLLSDIAPTINAGSAYLERGGIYKVYSGSTLLGTSDTFWGDEATSNPRNGAVYFAYSGSSKIVKEAGGAYTAYYPDPNIPPRTGITTLEEAESIAFAPGCSIVTEREGKMVAIYHPFGYYNYNIVGKGSSVANKLYLPYGHRGYNEPISESASDVKNCELWKVPLLTSFLGGFTTENYKIENDSFVVKIYKNGAPYTTGTVYAKSSTNEYYYNVSSSIPSSTYDASKGGFEFLINNNLYENETVSFYSDSSCDESFKLGEINIKTVTTEYQIGDGVLGSTRSTKGLVLGESKQDEEMANITKTEYEMLLSKVNKLLEIINKNQ